jgi:hypothetical protein
MNNNMRKSGLNCRFWQPVRGTWESHSFVFKSRTLLPLIALLLVVFILAIVISPVVDIPKAGLRSQAMVLLFFSFSALLAAFEFCAGCALQRHSYGLASIPLPTSERQPAPSLLC